MPKPKTSPETEVSAAPATEPTAKSSRKSAAKPKAATTAAPHKHTRKSTKTAEIAIEASAATAGSVQEVPQKAPLAVTREEIAKLAYSYWVARGYKGGSPEEDWLRAERELQFLA